MNILLTHLTIVALSRSQGVISNSVSFNTSPASREQSAQRMNRDSQRTWRKSESTRSSSLSLALHKPTLAPLILSVHTAALQTCWAYLEHLGKDAAGSPSAMPTKKENGLPGKILCNFPIFLGLWAPLKHYISIQTWFLSHQNTWVGRKPSCSPNNVDILGPYLPVCVHCPEHLIPADGRSFGMSGWFTVPR